MAMILSWFTRPPETNSDLSHGRPETHGSLISVMIRFRAIKDHNRFSFSATMCPKQQAEELAETFTGKICTGKGYYNRVGSSDFEYFKVLRLIDFFSNLFDKKYIFDKKF